MVRFGMVMMKMSPLLRIITGFLFLCIDIDLTPHLVPALVAGDHSQVPIKHISASPRTQPGTTCYSCTQNDGWLTGSLLTNFTSTY